MWSYGGTADKESLPVADVGRSDTADKLAEDDQP